MIRREIGDTDSEYDREKLQERLAKLAGGIAQINVGAATETEMKERKALVEDALHATRAAIEEGVVPGGGTALIRAAAAIGDLKLTDDEALGADIVRRAVEQPARYIAENAGIDGAVVVNKIKKSNDPKFGYDAESGKWGDMFAAGIVDPTKVTRSALQNGASVAGLLLTTEALIAEPPKKKEAGGHDDPHQVAAAWAEWVAWEAWAAWEIWADGNDVIDRDGDSRSTISIEMTRWSHRRRNLQNKGHAFMAKQTIRPLEDRVVIQQIEAEEKTAGGIVLPDTAKEKPQRGKVLAVGPGKLLDSGERRRSASSRATRCSSASIPAPRSRWTARRSRSSASPTSWRRSSSNSVDRGPVAAAARSDATGRRGHSACGNH